MKTNQETIRDKWFRYAHKVVPDKEWASFVLSSYIWGDVLERFPDYCRKITNEIRRQEKNGMQKAQT